MRLLVLTFGVSCAAISPAAAMEEMSFHLARAEIDAAIVGDEAVLAWDDADVWFGGDRNKLWFKSEGEVIDGNLEAGEVQALWSRNIAPFWDLQAGARIDIEPETTSYLTLALQGLAPYQFETEIEGFLSEQGDVSARFKQSFDLLFTQRLVLEPYVEAEAFAQAVASRDVGAGLSNVAAGLQLRYEFTRKIAPYLDLNFTRDLGETAQITRARGEDVEATMLRAGLRFWF